MQINHNWHIIDYGTKKPPIKKCIKDNIVNVKGILSTLELVIIYVYIVIILQL